MPALYIVVKLCVYCGLCYGAARMFRLTLHDPWTFSFAWGAGRLLIGFAFGMPIIYTFAQVLDATGSPFASYLSVFTPFRLVEWALVFALLARKYALTWDRRAFTWIIGATILSMVPDGFAVATGLHNIKFVC